MRILVLGYGNPDREDDGVAWHILTILATRLGQPVPVEPGTPFAEGQSVTLLFSLQLTPEHVETIAEYDHVWFVDAHTGRVPQDIHIETVLPEFQNSPFTHHFTPQSCLSLAGALYHARPVCELISVRGYNFGFNRQLSLETQALSNHAANWIYNKINHLIKLSHAK